LLQQRATKTHTQGRTALRLLRASSTTHVTPFTPQELRLLGRRVPRQFRDHVSWARVYALTIYSNGDTACSVGYDDDSLQLFPRTELLYGPRRLLAFLKHDLPVPDELPSTAHFTHRATPGTTSCAIPVANPTSTQVVRLLSLPAINWHYVEAPSRYEQIH